MHKAKPRVIDCLVSIKVNTEYAQGEAEGNRMRNMLKAKPRVIVLNTEYARGEAEGNRPSGMYMSKYGICTRRSRG